MNDGILEKNESNLIESKRNGNGNGMKPEIPAKNIPMIINDNSRTNKQKINRQIAEKNKTKQKHKKKPKL